MPMQANEAKWKEWNGLGFIPGAHETEEAFYKRVAYCQELDRHLENSVADLPFKKEDENSQDHLHEAFSLTKELYGIEPKWVLLFFSNYQLAPWHGGCAWIFQLNPASPVTGFLQLRAHFRRFSTFLSFYKRQELIAHELAHMGRMVYEEPKFEELMAYQSSSSWRRWLGPLVQSARESLLFILFLTIAVITNIAFISSGGQLSSLIAFIKFIPLILFLFALSRLFMRHFYYRRCLKQLCQIFPDQIAKHFIYRLRDKEISRFSQLSPSEIKKEVFNESKKTFRWLFLKTIYSCSFIK